MTAECVTQAPRPCAALRTPNGIPLKSDKTEPDRLCLNQEEERRGQKKTHSVLCFFFFVEETDATNKALAKCDQSLELRGGVDIGGISIQTRPFDFCDRVGAH